jgi:hypothetical protein
MKRYYRYECPKFGICIQTPEVLTHPPLSLLFCFSPPLFFLFEKARFFLFPRTDKNSGQSGNLRVRHSNRATSTRRREALFPGNASQAAQH